MKKFFTLFALLSVALSASAETYNLSIWYETTNLRSDLLPNVHMFIDNNTHTTWPGPEMTWVKDTGTTKVYKWEGSLDFMPTNFIYSYNKDQESASFVFVNGGYYIDGVYDHTVGKTGYTIYWDNSETSWWSNVYLYTWHNAKNINSGWTRYKMESLGNNLYSFHVSDEDFNNVIFNNGGEQGSNQTVNVEGAQGDVVYTANGQIGHNDKYNVTNAGPAFLTVTDGQPLTCNKNYIASSATYSRNTGSNQWGTLCLPFAFKANNNMALYTIDRVENGVMYFTSISEVSAGQPCIFKLNTPGEFTITGNNVPVVKAPQEPTGDGWQMFGSFTGTSSGDNTYYYISNVGGEEGVYYGTGITIPAYRAWFNAPAGFTPAPLRFSTDETEGLQIVEQEDGTVKAYYDLQGRKLDGARKGLVIENGKIIMVK